MTPLSKRAQSLDILKRAKYLEQKIHSIDIREPDFHTKKTVIDSSENISKNICAHQLKNNSGKHEYC